MKRRSDNFKRKLVAKIQAAGKGEMKGILKAAKVYSSQYYQWKKKYAPDAQIKRVPEVRDGGTIVLTPGIYETFSSHSPAQKLLAKIENHKTEIAKLKEQLLAAL